MALTDMLNGIELRHLRALQAVAQTGSFHEAADVLGYTQPAISQQIAALERALGQQLFDRAAGRSRVSLTEAGETMLRHAEAVFARLGEAVTELGALDRGMSGSVRVGYFESVGRHVLPRLLRRMTERSRHLELHLSARECDLELQQQLERGDLDLAFVISPLSEQLSDLEVFEDRAVAVVANSDPLATRENVCIGDLDGRRLATFSRSPYMAVLEVALGVRRSAEIAVRSDDNGTLTSVAESGDAVALMTELSARGSTSPGVRAIPLIDAPARRIGLAWRTTSLRSGAIMAAIEETVAACQELHAQDAAPRGDQMVALAP